MILERTKNTKRNIIWGTINKFVLVLLPFIIRTLIIRELGIEYVGLNSLFSSVLSVLSLTELGFDSAVVFVMYNGVAHDDIRLLNALLAFIRKAYLIIGSVILTLGSLCIPFLPHLVNDIATLPSDINLYHIYIVFLVGTVISYFFGGYRNTIVVAFQRNDIISNINTVARIVFFGIQVYVLMHYHNYYYYIYTLPICNIAINLLVVHQSKRLFPYILPKGKVSEDDKKLLKRLVAGAFIQKVGAILTVTLDSVIISAFIGVRLLGYYSNYSYITTSLIGFLFIIYTSMQGGLGNSLLLDSVEKNYKDMLRFNFIYSWLIGWCFFCCIFLFQPFILLWIGEKAILPDFIMVLLCVFLHQGECFGVFGSYKAALGIVWEDRYRPLFSGVFKLVLSLIFVYFLRDKGDEYALGGVVVSSIISYIFISSPWSAYVLFQKYFKKGLVYAYLKTYMYFFFTILAVVLSYPLFALFPAEEGTQGYVNFLFRILLCLIIPNVLFYIYFHALPEFKEAKLFIISRLKK